MKEKSTNKRTLYLKKKKENPKVTYMKWNQ
jgi:hypothetical protein